MQKKFLIIGLTLIFVCIAAFLIYHVVVNANIFKCTPSIAVDEEAMLLDKAQKLFADGELLKTRDLYQMIIEKFPNSKNIIKMQEALDNVNMAILFSSIPARDSLVYEVQKGDSLSKLAKKFNTTIELISKANNLKNYTIRLGQALKITKAVFSIVVDKSQNILTLKSDGHILKTYRVSTGKNSSTPVGNFKIATKVVNPVWYTQGAVVPPDSPNNILGSRWLGISKPGYGIHGTLDPQSIGKSVTAGCVRMNNTDVEELYSIVPEGIEVVIVD